MTFHKGLVGVATGLSLAAFGRIWFEAFDLSTGLLFIAAIASIVLVVTDAIAGARQATDRTRTNLRFMWIVVFILIAGFEAFARVGIERAATYLERNNGGSYVSLRRASSRERLFVNRKNAELIFHRPEFTYVRRTNSLGLSEKEIPVSKPADEFRIIALGDSFTEGVGAPYEATWVKVLEQTLAARLSGRHVTTINAGIGGSDPCFQYVLFAEVLAPLAPNLVIVATNSSDVFDIATRGGMERFLPDGSVRPIRPPSWEWLYGISYLTRLYVHGPLGYTPALVPARQALQNERAAIPKILGALDAFAVLSKRLGFELVLALLPSSAEVLQGRYGAPFGELSRIPSPRGDMHIVDVMRAFKADKSIDREHIAEFFWPIDFHPTPKGYAVIGRALADELLNLQLVD